ncbi:hypothetical protein ACH5RR_025825 [Cinchona calisaya]|uniref:Uncharacterized protein n=1 Tax=Cinchona calisaya TaxID=153742 RepID=A0ABD2Z5T1_9GENT
MGGMPKKRGVKEESKESEKGKGAKKEGQEGGGRGERRGVDEVSIDEASNLIMSNVNKDTNIIHSSIPIEKILKIGMEFETENAAYDFYLAYAKEAGFA